MNTAIKPREAVYSLYRTFGVGITGEKPEATIVLPATPVDNSNMTACAFLQLVKGLEENELKEDHLASSSFA